MKGFLAAALLLLTFNVCSAQVADSSRLAPVSAQAKVYQCYGKSETAKWENGSQWDSDWYRCDGWENNEGKINVYVSCPPGMVQKGVYIWHYTSGGGNVSRCRVVCQKITTTTEAKICGWKGVA